MPRSAPGPVANGSGGEGIVPAPPPACQGAGGQRNGPGSGPVPRPQETSAGPHFSPEEQRVAQVAPAEEQVVAVARLGEPALLVRRQAAEEVVAGEAGLDALLDHLAPQDVAGAGLVGGVEPLLQRVERAAVGV